MSSLRTLLVHPEDEIGPIESAFDAAGFDVTTVHTATAAIAEATTAEYDCVVSEYALPGDDGVSLAEAMTDADLDLPVVLFTAASGEARAVDALERGVEEIHRKNGSGSVDRLVSNLSARCTEGTQPRARQDVRRVSGVFRSEYEGVALRSRSERESRDRSLTEFAAAVDDRLTDRQRTALRTAELNGYFARPRPVDGSEIAEQMGITRQTFHQHLRAAERKLVEAYVSPRSDE